MHRYKDGTVVQLARRKCSRTVVTQKLRIRVPLTISQSLQIFQKKKEKKKRSCIGKILTSIITGLILGPDDLTIFKFIFCFCFKSISDSINPYLVIYYFLFLINK